MSLISALPGGLSTDTSEMKVPTEPVTCPAPGTKRAISPAASGGGAAVVTVGGTVSTTVTVLTDGGGVASSAFFDEEPLRKTSERLPAADPKSSVRLLRSTVKVNVDVVPAGIVSRPLCGISHGTSARRNPVSVALPLLVKLIDPVGDAPICPAKSTRFAFGRALTAPAGGAAENTFNGTCSCPWMPVALRIAAPSKTPLASAFAVTVTTWLAPGAIVNCVGLCEKKFPL